MIDNLTDTADTDTPTLKQARALLATLPAKLEEHRKALAKAEQKYRAAEATLRKHDKVEQRKKRTRLVSHAGGMMEMTNLLGYRFVGTAERDNPQDDLRANLLVGSLLQLSNYLSVASAEELNRLSADGKAFRALKPSERTVPEINSLIILGDIDS